MRRKRLKKTKNLFLGMCLRILFGNPQRVCKSKLLKSLYPNAHMYAKLALNILEKVAPPFSSKGNSFEGQRKRKRSDSESVSGSGSSSFSFRGSDYFNSSGSTAGCRQSRGFYAPQLTEAAAGLDGRPALPAAK
jgi:hypothetical protein